MGIKIGEVDVVSQIIENEFRVSVLERLVELLLGRISTMGGSPISPQDLAQVRHEVVEHLKKKYPNSGIALREEPK